MTVEEFLESTYKNETHLVRPRMVCNDGFSISVQGGTWHHYCSPQPNFHGLPLHQYDTVELGFPSSVEDSIMPYAEDDGSPTDTVYGHVPLRVVEYIANKHGGVKPNDD